MLSKYWNEFFYNEILFRNSVMHGGGELWK